jgi:hypothetical protein
MSGMTSPSANATPRAWRLFWILAAILGALYILNYFLIPVPLIPVLGHDDGHFMRQAKTILDGQWLGPYDQLTLIKGPGFPIFLSLSRAARLPYPILLAVFEFSSFALLSYAVGRVANSTRLAIALLVALAVFPWMWSGSVLRVLRDGFYTSLLLMCLALAILVIWTDVRRKWLIALMAGLSFGWMTITREETPWLWPAVAALAICFFIAARQKRETLRRSVLILLCAVAGSMMPTVFVASMNYAKYGVFLVTDFTDRNFREALRALYSVEAGERTAYLPASRAARLVSYQQSPTFARLRDALDGDPAAVEGWQWPGCSMHGGKFCGDYAGGWFMWAVRDAVADAGEYKTAAAAIAFYRSMAAEINLACREGRLTCRYSPFAELPPVIADNVAKTLHAIGEVIARISLVTPLPLDPPASEGSSGGIHLAAYFLRVKMISPKPSADHDVVVSRWHGGGLVQATGAIQRGAREFVNVVWPVLALAGSVAIALATVLSIRRQSVQPALLITWILLVFVASRTALMALIDGFLFRAINMEYTTPAAYCLVAAVVTGIYCAISELRALSGLSLRHSNA